MLKGALSFLSLFSSFGTLVCCALPALFVSLGFGATFVSVLGAFPQLIWISERKILVFTVAGVLLAITAFMRAVGQKQECPVDPKLAAHCRNLRNSRDFIFYLSVGCYLIGGFFAFVAPRLF